VEFDRRGYTVKMHAAGDRAIREGLDAIAAARRANPNGQLRHELAHAGYIAPPDLNRFAQLNAVAEFSPVIWYPSPIIDAVVAVVGERANHYWPMRSLLATHAPLAAGSDWPSVVPSMDPWAASKRWSPAATRTIILRRPCGLRKPSDWRMHFGFIRSVAQLDYAGRPKPDPSLSESRRISSYWIAIYSGADKSDRQSEGRMTFFQGRKVYQYSTVDAAKSRGIS